MLEIYNNKVSFLNLKPIQVKMILIIILGSIFIGLLGSLKLMVYSNYRTKGYILCKESCEIITIIPTNIEYEKVSINKQEENITLIRKEIVVDEEKMESFYKIYFKSNKTFLDKEIVDLNFYYNQETLFTKIKQKLF